MRSTSNGESTALRVSLREFNNSGFSRGRGPIFEGLWLLLQWLLVSSWLPGSAHRRWILRLFGAHVGKGVQIKPRIRVKFPWRLSIGDYTWLGEDVWVDNLVEINIGSNCCISQGAYLCTGSHNWTKRNFELLVKPVIIEDESWICAHAMVAPGVRVGRGAVLSMGSVATSDLKPWTVYLGVPAQVRSIRSLQEASDHERASR